MQSQNAGRDRPHPGRFALLRDPFCGTRDALCETTAMDSDDTADSLFIMLSSHTAPLTLGALSSIPSRQTRNDLNKVYRLNYKLGRPALEPLVSNEIHDW